jgi:Lar family restriction alleviation protein
LSETLKPCPFCGGDPVFHCSTGRVHKTGNIYSIYSVDCNDCDLTGPRAETRKGAAIAWNRRASGWISVKDGLPELFTGVMFYLDEPGPCIVANGFYIGKGQWQIFTGVTVGREVTHWRPIPDPPGVDHE